MPLKPNATPKQAKEPVLTAQILLIGQFHIKMKAIHFMTFLG
jgi:hypothetical protein